ncbi:hypothetical protein DY000_02000202 [Brassica cretica]|uniref:Uncharacterized protein n=1 Tax=Brassica cretica TaxID=69181 RepID=A0ABQ7BST5_BRACR|nr:hypothetical protein DY000_02000202 [Brassica cretica]
MKLDKQHHEELKMELTESAVNVSTFVIEESSLMQKPDKIAQNEADIAHIDEVPCVTAARL